MTRSLLTALLILISNSGYAADVELKVKEVSELAITGPEIATVGKPVTFLVTGLPAVNLDATIGEQVKWIDYLKLSISAPKSGEAELEKELSMSVAPWSWRLKATFTPKVNGTYVLVCDWNEKPFGLVFVRVDVGGSITPSDPTDPLMRVTYIYEKNQSPVPQQVSAAIAKLNERPGLVAAEFERDTKDGNNKMPEQFKIAAEAAEKAGLPALVIQKDDIIYRVLESPTTEKEIMEALE